LDLANWQVTATTIYCDAVDDEVTIMVYRDWSAKCTGSDKYSASSREAMKALRKKSKQLKRPLGCTGPGCDRVNKYEEMLSTEEANSSRPSVQYGRRRPGRDTS